MGAICKKQNNTKKIEPTIKSPSTTITKPPLAGISPCFMSILMFFQSMKKKNKTHQRNMKKKNKIPQRKTVSPSILQIKYH